MAMTWLRSRRYPCRFEIRSIGSVFPALWLLHAYLSWWPAFGNRLAYTYRILWIKFTAACLWVCLLMRARVYRDPAQFVLYLFQTWVLCRHRGWPREVFCLFCLKFATYGHWFCLLWTWRPPFDARRFFEYFMRFICVFRRNFSLKFGFMPCSSFCVDILFEGTLVGRAPNRSTTVLSSCS